MIPIILKLKRKSHKEIAQAQDIIIEELYKVFSDAVLHGGTVIWRCYKGNRFSEDIDIYINRDVKKIDLVFNNLKKRGFDILKKRIKQNSLFSVLEYNRSLVRLEGIFKKVDSMLKEYETVDGNLIMVYVLTVSQLVREKISAYIERLKIRDLYDVFFLLRYLTEDDFNIIKRDIENLIKNFEKPIDENELRILIIEGIVPDVNEMFEYIKNKIKGKAIK